MTLASRLSTLANLLDSNAKEKSSSQYWSVAWANLALVQVQAVIVGTLAAIFALFMHWVSSSSQNGSSTETDLRTVLMVLTSSVLTASIASFVLGIVMVQGEMFIYLQFSLKWKYESNFLYDTYVK